MKYINFKFQTSQNKHFRDITMEESIEKNGILSISRKRCRYFVLKSCEIHSFGDLKSLETLNLAGRHNKKRHFLVLKDHNSKEGRDSFFCKVAGIFYAVCNNRIYCIAYVHSYKITFITAVSIGGAKDEIF